MTSLKSIFLLLRSKVQDSYVRNPQDKNIATFITGLENRSIAEREVKGQEMLAWVRQGL